ncbi:hypothetical protein EJA01_01060 [Rhodovulum iodosum]|nr:hypothetical protein [Rhodovulum robiginosum]RSK39652.1 hypothetical protein EJA01_01060 [Rhodovulum robiginosum]
MRTRQAAAMVALAALAGCAAPSDDLPPMVELGDFRLGHNIVVAGNAQQIPPSREASAAEWEAVLKEEIARRFDRYQGDKLYHFGLNVDGYALAVPGVPVVLAPKSVLVLSANIWDDAQAAKLHAKPKRLTVFEELDGDTVIGSGLTRTREEQMRALARNAALQMERWLLENRSEWFGETASAGPRESAN